MRSRWKSWRHRLEWGGVRLLAFLIPRLSRSAAVKFAQIAGAFAARFDFQGRRVAL
jgi:lauroyl/myristoyl acyltransferase